jgi:hypothetical protein
VSAQTLFVQETVINTAIDQGNTVLDSVGIATKNVDGSQQASTTGTDD